eukprot:SAG31_NODE_18582_length_630_cov_16.973635_1_plen_26_part_01
MEEEDGRAWGEGWSDGPKGHPAARPS